MRTRRTTRRAQVLEAHAVVLGALLSANEEKWFLATSTACSCLCVCVCVCVCECWSVGVR